VKMAVTCTRYIMCELILVLLIDGIMCFLLLCFAEVRLCILR